MINLFDSKEYLIPESFKYNVILLDLIFLFGNDMVRISSLY